MTPLILAGEKETIYRSPTDSDVKMPFATFLPQGYEPRYAYPLLVFLHGRGESEQQWIDLAPTISRRNYICLSLRGPQPVARPDGTVGYGWGDGDGDRELDLEASIFEAIRETMRSCHIHSQRIFLAGCCEGAATALRIGLTYPEKFAGVVSFNGWLPKQPVVGLGRFKRHRRLAVFVGHGTLNRVVSPKRCKEAFSLFYSAGIPVSMRSYPVGHGIHQEMLRDMDRWVLRTCEQIEDANY